MRFSYNWLKELVNFKETPQKLGEILSLRAFEVETIEKVGRDVVLEIKITANRAADAANHLGMAREIAALKKIKIAEEKFTGASVKKMPDLDLKISRPEICSRYTARILELKKNGPSPKWMQEKLLTCGLRPIDAVVDATNYAMLETGQPLHAFDLDKIKKNKMNLREAKKGEELTTLDGTRHILPEGALVAEDGERRLIDLVGIMGGDTSAVDKNTRRILLQAATFNSAKIYRTARLLNFSTDASRLYSSDLDPNLTVAGLERATELLEDAAGAKKIGPILDIYPRPVLPLLVAFRPKFADEFIGQELPEKFYEETFNYLGLTVKSKGEIWKIEIPTRRRDLGGERDLIEEAARIFGYENLRAKLPETNLAPSEPCEERSWEIKIEDYLKGLGFSESFLYEFTSAREMEEFFLDSSRAPELQNPINPETQYLTPRILTKYLKSAAANLRNFDEVKIFGLMKSFQKERRRIEPAISEEKTLVLILAKKDSAADIEFYRLKGAVDELLDEIGVTDHWYDDALKSDEIKEFETYHPYRRAEIKIGEENLGKIGETHPAILKNLKTKVRVLAAEINFAKLARLAASEAEFEPIAKFPVIIRDLAVLLPADVRVEEILSFIENSGGPLLKDTDLFDYFRDEEMKTGNLKSLAFHLIFQSPEKTLQDEEINEILKKIVRALEDKGWEIRQ